MNEQHSHGMESLGLEYCSACGRDSRVTRGAELVCPTCTHDEKECHCRPTPVFRIVLALELIAAKPLA